MLSRRSNEHRRSCHTAPPSSYQRCCALRLVERSVKERTWGRVDGVLSHTFRVVHNYDKMRTAKRTAPLTNRSVDNVKFRDNGTGRE